MECHGNNTWQQFVLMPLPQTESAGTLFLWDRKPYEQIMGERQFK